MTQFDDRLVARLEERRAAKLYRSRVTLEGPQAPSVNVDGTAYLGFSSNDYLGLANDARVVAAFKEGLARYGSGSGASHLVLGHSRAHHQLEEALAEHTGRERALLFSTGYMANLGTLSALVGKGDRVFQDRLNHASLLDGGLLSGARFKRYRHADPNHLEQLLAQTPNDQSHSLVVTDGVFSMDGDLAPVTRLAELCQQHQATLMVDDAHGFGCLGANGGGLAELNQLDQDRLPVLMGTLGKALGTSGAFVCGSQTLIEYLIQFARPYIYTTAIPPSVAHATLTSLEIVRAESWRRTQLNQLIQRFRVGADQLGYRVMESQTAIQPLLVHSSEAALRLSAALREEGIYVSAIRPPTVPQNQARLRVTLSAAHTESEVDRLLDALAKHQDTVQMLHE